MNMLTLHVILMFADHSILTRTMAVPASGSLSEGIVAMGKEPEVSDKMDGLVRAIRILDSEVFVDDREQFLWLAGYRPDRPNFKGHQARIPPVKDAA
jgi:hypothetical protein